MRAQSHVSEPGGVHLSAVSNLSPVAAGALREESDAYPALVRLNPNWRVITDGRQFILQRVGGLRKGNRVWVSQSFCIWSETLLRLVGKHAGPISSDARAALRSLPERIRESQS